MLYIRYLGKDYPAVDDPGDWLGPEATDVEKHFGVDLLAGPGDPRQITSRQAIYGLAYVTLKRAHRKVFTWEVLEGMTQSEVMGLLVNLDEHGNEIPDDTDADVEGAAPVEVPDPPTPPADEDHSIPSGTPTGGDSYTSGTGHSEPWIL